MFISEIPKELFIQTTDSSNKKKREGEGKIFFLCGKGVVSRRALFMKWCVFKKRRDETVGWGGVGDSPSRGPGRPHLELCFRNFSPRSLFPALPGAITLSKFSVPLCWLLRLPTAPAQSCPCPYSMVFNMGFQQLGLACCALKFICK